MVSRIHPAQADPAEISSWDHLNQFSFPRKALREGLEAGPNPAMNTKHKVQSCVCRAHSGVQRSTWCWVWWAGDQAVPKSSQCDGREGAQVEHSPCFTQISCLSNSTQRKVTPNGLAQRQMLSIKIHISHVCEVSGLCSLHSTKAEKWTVPHNSPTRINLPRAGRAWKPQSPGLSWSKTMMFLHSTVKKPHWSQNSKCLFYPYLSEWNCK